MNLSNITLTKNDFINCNYEFIIDSCEKKECSKYRELFWKQVEEAKTKNEEKIYGVFTLLSAITSSYLKLDNHSEPFTYIEAIDSISDKHLDVLKDWVQEISDGELKARVVDILWFKKRDYKMALLAIDAYLQSAKTLEDPEDWGACVDRIHRAVQLSKLLNQKKDKIIQHIEEVLNKYNGEDPLFLSLRLMEFLQNYKHGDTKKYSALSKKAALNAEARQNYNLARDYWQMKCQWHHLAGEDDKERDSWLNLSETYVTEAEKAIQREDYISACHNLKYAIEAFKKRSETQKRVKEVHIKLREYQPKMLEKMIPMNADPIDITKMVNYAREQVKNKTFLEAIHSLVKPGNSPRIKDIREQVIENFQKYLGAFLLTDIIVNELGKIQAIQPSVYSNDPNEKEQAIKSSMHQNANYYKHLHTEAFIEPARYQIILEHDVRVNDWLPIILNNPFVPSGREIIYARAFQAGLVGDFLISSHLLIPQIESSIRYLLYQKGVITSYINDRGIENEYDLNKTLYMDETKQILGEDLTFDLEGLLVNRFGKNLRNLNCHGLIDSRGYNSTCHSYLWWLILRICCLPIMSHKLTQSQEENIDNELQDNK